MPKTFLLTAIGTRGDVQPLVIIGKRLMQDGHLVRIGVDPAFRDSVEQQGCVFFPVAGFDPEKLMGSPITLLNVHTQAYKHFQSFREVCDNTYLACTTPWKDGTPFNVDVIISSDHHIAVLPLAEKFGAALMFYDTYPKTPTVEFRAPFGFVLEGKDSRDTPRLNLLTYWAYDLFQQSGLGHIVKDFRLKLGMTESLGGRYRHVQDLLVSFKVPVLGIWSPNVVPKPLDWHENVVVCGSVDRTGGLPDLPAELLKYISEGEAPIFFGFGPGSMAHKATLTRAWLAAVAAVRELKCRAVFHVSNADLPIVESCVPEGAFLLNQPVPHSKLFQLCSIVVHHGGPGTLDAALRAGKPNVIVSFVLDHPFWGHRLSNLNVGEHVRASEATAQKLVDSIRRVQQPDVLRSCAELQDKMLKEEHGTDVVVREIYRRLPEGKIDYQALAKHLPPLDPVTQLFLFIVGVAGFFMAFFGALSGSVRSLHVTKDYKRF